MRNKQKETETTEAAVRVMHHTERPALPAGSTKAKAYFDGLQNDYECCFQWGMGPRRAPSQSELDFFGSRYTAWINTRNRACMVAGNKSRMISAAVLHGKARSCPEELTIQLTAKGDEQVPDQRTFRKCMQAYIDWMRRWGIENGDCLHVLGAYIAKDIPCKIVIRRVWDYETSDGIRKVGQTGALRQAGVPCPEEEAEESRYNNRKMTFDRYSREALYGILEDAGMTVIREPRIYTLRQAQAARDEAAAEEKDAAAMLKELMDIEAQAPLFNEDEDVPGVIRKNGRVLIPEGAWRIMKIRACLGGAYDIRVQEAQERLDAVLAEEQQELIGLTARRGALEAAEMEYVRLCRGLMRLGYNPMDIDGTDGAEGGEDSEGIPYEYEETGLSEPQ